MAVVAPMGEAPVMARRDPKVAAILVAAFVAGIDDAVKPQLKNAVPLGQFLAKVKPLSLAERRTIVDQAVILLENFYVHLPMKRAMHGIDPVRRLELLRLRLDRISSDISFHHEMTDVFMSMCDLHTNYLLPAPYNRAVAFLPFQVEHFFDGARRRYVVSAIMPGFRSRTFQTGVEITHWNGIPIERAVELVGEKNAGSNEAARHARGLARLTVRPMIRSLPPDEEWVDVSYVTGDGRAMELEYPWLVFRSRREEEKDRKKGAMRRAMALGLDIETDEIRRAKKLAFAVHVVRAERGLSPARGQRAVAGIRSAMPSVFEAREVHTDHGTFAYVRIRTFFVDDADAFVREFIRLIEHLPQNGLIIDVRDNGGGLLMSGEQLLQTLTPQRIEPERLQVICTPLCEELCSADRSGDLSRWVPSMKRARHTGALYSAGITLRSADECNAIGQRYFGPVVLITNALCYSTTDIFVAGFKDHGIGTILGTDENTGAGGANVWTHALIRRVLRSGRQSRNASLRARLRPLPKDAGMRVALRRTLRVRDHADTELEGLGVEPDDLHRMTRNDLLHHNGDLIEHAARFLVAKPAYKFAANGMKTGKGVLTLQMATANMNRLEVVLDGRLVDAFGLKRRGDERHIEQRIGDARTLELRGLLNGRLVAVRKVGLRRSRTA